MKDAWIWVLVAVAAIAIGWFAYRRIASSLGPELDTAPLRAAPSAEASIYQLIKEQVDGDPDAPLRFESLPVLEITEGGIGYVPGAMDSLFGSGEAGDDDDTWKIVPKVIRAINKGRVADWRIIEKNVKDVGISSCVDTVLGSLYVADVTPAVKRLFWEAAKNSRDYNTVKWGIAIGGLDLSEQELPILLTLARHGEFTLYAAHVLLRESEKQPSLKRHLVGLLPVSRQWGVIRLIDIIVLDKSLIEEPAVQRDVLIYGMENNDGIPMEVAFTIASAVNLPTLFVAGEGDERVYRAGVLLMDTLLLEPAPLGGLTDLKDWPRVYDGFLVLIEKRTADIPMLSALASLETWLSDKDLTWERKNAELGRVRRLTEERLSAEIVRRGLENERDRWNALNLIGKHKLTVLLPAVEVLFKTKPDFSTISTLSALGGRDQLQLMLDTIPTLVDLDAREGKPMSHENINTPWPEAEKGMLYSQIVRSLGQLATMEAIAHIKRAGTDFDPAVRAAACAAIAGLPADLVDDDLRRIVTERLTDEPKYVADSAKEAAAKLGLKFP
jgi:HEAT repeat protein